MLPSHPSLVPWSPVNLRDPMNRQHPLNRGRLTWHLAMPGLTGGRQFFDLCGLTHGTLTILTTAGWRPTYRPGGAGLGNVGMGFNTSGYVDLGTPPAVKAATAITVAAWATATTSRGDLFSQWGASNRFLLSSAIAAAGKFSFYVENSSGSSFINVDASVSITTGNWCRVLGTYDGTTVRIYINGVAAGSTGGGVGLFTGSTGNVKIGDSAAVPYSGVGDDFTIWGRALSAAEAQQDYDLSRRGYPGVLNRIPFGEKVTVPAGPAKVGNIRRDFSASLRRRVLSRI